MSQSRKRHLPDREQFLSQLVQEYHTTKDNEAKQQVLANLGNFAYDSINHGWLWQVNVIEIFIDAIQQQDPLLKEFGAGGLANICLDPQHYQYLISNPKHIESIVALIQTNTQQQAITTDTVINAMTTLMLLVNESSQEVILTKTLKEALLNLQQHQQVDTRIVTVATVFLTDYFSISY
ncbi:hypothetical protein BDA99DRAFT_313479 [Phascolomyces articulosus]|uniref:Armadillo repeat-containing protein 7 n=1 Tax=Phascolomyces articulosus TaxID=60185 RepID=A0AAD5JLW1_9FUNG|nr:hypothetical protein BDA99DRAFT_313479 [Phascolomyces articulosus]